MVIGCLDVNGIAANVGGAFKVGGEEKGKEERGREVKSVMCAMCVMMFVM